MKIPPKVTGIETKSGQNSKHFDHIFVNERRNHHIGFTFDDSRQGEVSGDFHHEDEQGE